MPPSSFSREPSQLLRQLVKAGYKLDRKRRAHAILFNTSGWRVTIPLGVRKVMRGVLVENLLLNSGFWKESGPRKRAHGVFQTGMILTLKADLDVEYDSEADAAYIRVKTGKVARTERLSLSVMIDLNAAGELLGVEVINASLGPKHASALRKVSKRFNLPQLLKVHHTELLPKIYS